jgi:DNA-binding PadR family transcriptional regulator
MKKQDWLILYLSLPSATENNMLDPIRIMKGLFLFKMEFKEKLNDFYDYIPYLYGPCSFEIYKDLIELQLKGIVDSYSQPLYRWSYYRLTKKGQTLANFLVNDVPKEFLEKLKAIKLKVTSLSFFELLREVYKKYPEFAKNSVINFGEQI